MPEPSVPISFIWTDFLDLAKELTGKSDIDTIKEAMQRTAISRAYYASFGFARVFIENKYSISFESSFNIHSDIQDWFINNNNRECRRIGSKLQRLRKFRNQADYDNQMDRIDEIVEHSLVYSSYIIDKLKYGVIR